MNNPEIWNVEGSPAKIIWYKYMLHYDMIEACRSGAFMHPQLEMNIFIDEINLQENISVEIIEAIPQSIGDAWQFLIKATSPWLALYFPKWITIQGIEEK